MNLFLMHHAPAFIVAVIAVGRATRLLVFDDWPPGKAFRERFVVKMGETWGPLILCPFCTAPYLAAGDLAWYALAWEFSETALIIWWIVNVWAAISYLAAILVAYDQPED